MKKLLSVFTALTLICATVMTGVVSVHADDGVKLTGIYDKENYTFYGTSGYDMTFDAQNKTIVSNSKQNKAMLNYTKDMTEFEASLTLKGKSDGAIYAGISFHVQEGDFKSGTFNSSGYSVILKRNSETGYDTPKIIVRYCTGGSSKKEISTVCSKISTDTELKLRMEVKVGSTDFYAVIYDGSKEIGRTDTYALNATATYTNTSYYSSGALAFIANGINTFSDISVTAYGGVTDVPQEQEPPVNKLANYNIYGSVVTDDNDFTVAESSVARGVLKDTTVTDFSAEAKLKINGSGDLKTGIIFRTGTVGTGTNDLEGYSVVLQKTAGTTGNYARMLLLVYKYGVFDGNYTYLGQIGRIENTAVMGYFSASADKAAGEELYLHVNVVGDTVEAYFYGYTNPNNRSEMRKSQILSLSLRNVTDVEKNNYEILSQSVYYSSGGIGFYNSKDCMINAVGLTVSAAEPLTGASTVPEEYQGGVPAKESNRGVAVKGTNTSVSAIKGTSIAAPGIKDLDEYTANFDNYTFYSTSSNSFIQSGNTITSPTLGTKRAILDGVTASGFHATATMRIDEEGTLKSGIVFRVNNIEAGMENGVLPANNIEGYAAILYKTPGNSGDYSRVVLCIYKYGIKKGVYQYLGTVASKASEIPLTGCGENIADAAGKSLTLDVNVVDDELTAYFYNTDDPSLKSEKLSTNLTKLTDIENSTPSLAGVHYDSGAIGLTAQNYVTFTGFTLSEPIRPSNEVGSLDDLDSYTVYGSGVEEKDGYLVANSSGTKKVVVNNVTVKDFKASMDMTIDSNGNLKTGLFFRVNDVGNSADEQEGYALAVTRNYSTNGETNPNRIDIVLFKWGKVSGKFTYLGEVAREVYKSGTSFMDGKMDGKELTFVVSVQGSAIDATLYLKDDPTLKPVTYSSNLKFKGKNEKEDIQYFESGSIGIYMGNSVSDPVNYNKVRNFRIDDGSGIPIGQIKSNSVVVNAAELPMTGQQITFIAVLWLFAVAAVAVTGLSALREKSVNMGEKNS